MLKKLLKPFVPRALIEHYHNRKARRIDRQFASAPAAEVFETVYRDRIWGGESSDGFCSGEGSSDPRIVTPYVAAVSAFLKSLPVRPRAVDLGCGDFNVGSQLREHCAEYVACDIVASLIERNRERFADRNVEFRAVDIARDPLPPGDVVFIRQVLQHMSNAQIAAVVPKLAQYRWAVITEHLPDDPGFVPNLDKLPGPGIRVPHGSGVVLTAPPFNFRASERELCLVQWSIGRIRTLVYEPKRT